MTRSQTLTSQTSMSYIIETMWLGGLLVERRTGAFLAFLCTAPLNRLCPCYGTIEIVDVIIIIIMCIHNIDDANDHLISM